MVTKRSAAAANPLYVMEQMSERMSDLIYLDKQRGAIQNGGVSIKRQSAKNSNDRPSGPPVLILAGNKPTRRERQAARAAAEAADKKQKPKDKPTPKPVKPEKKPEDVKESELRKQDEKMAKSKQHSSSKTGKGKEANFQAPPRILSNWEAAQETVSCSSSDDVFQPSATYFEYQSLRPWHSSPPTSMESSGMRTSMTSQESPIQAAHTLETWDDDLEYHQEILDTVKPNTKEGFAQQSVHAEEIRTTPLFSAIVLRAIIEADSPVSPAILPQYGLLATVLGRYNDGSERSPDATKRFLEGTRQNGETESDGVSELRFSSLAIRQPDARLFLNINTPWSAFVCGSQGSGKSHTLSCMLESALQPSRLGPLVAPLAGMVFHYDKLTGYHSSQICEAAYLCSSGIPVKVLVSPSSYHTMKKVYENLPGVPQNRRPKVMPFFLTEAQLNIERMMKLMAVEDESRSSLYMEVVVRILRSMALRSPGNPGLDLHEFKRRLEIECFQPNQSSLIAMRLGLLESFMYTPDAAADCSAHTSKPYFKPNHLGKQQEREWQENQDRGHRSRLGSSTTWDSVPGSLTIVDLSCPFVDEATACALFNISVALFLDSRNGKTTTIAKERDTKPTGLILALDEAHKFMTPSASSSAFTETLLSIIRQQRHLAARVVVATQEPTISPKLLDLCSMTIVHRFSSPDWLKALAGHLAGVSVGEETNRKKGGLMEEIVRLEAGEALVFCPGAILGIMGDEAKGLKGQKLGLEGLKVRVRRRITEDGGRSILAA